MKYKVLSCNVFENEIRHAAKDSPHSCDLEFLELGEHARPGELRKKLQAKINAATNYDAVLLGYGLCGRATDGLTARTIPIILPRSHDCAGILLGCRKRFEEIFSKMPSTPFSSVGYIENGSYYFSDGDMLLGDSYAALVEQYGEDDAKYIYEAMHPKLDGELQPIYFIASPEIPSKAAAIKCREKATEEGREFRTLEGSLFLIKNLLGGNWPDDQFLSVQPGKTIRQVGDWDRIISDCD